MMIYGERVICFVAEVALRSSGIVIEGGIDFWIFRDVVLDPSHLQIF